MLKLENYYNTKDNLVCENHDLESGFMIFKNKNDYYYFEYDILEDVEGMNENPYDEFYLTRHCFIPYSEIIDFLTEGDTKHKTFNDVLEVIGYNKCLIKDDCLTEEEMNEMIIELRKEDNNE